MAVMRRAGSALGECNLLQFRPAANPFPLLAPSLTGMLGSPALLCVPQSCCTAWKERCDWVTPPGARSEEGEREEGGYTNKRKEGGSRGSESIEARNRGWSKAETGSRSLGQSRVGWRPKEHGGLG